MSFLECKKNECEKTNKSFKMVDGHKEKQNAFSLYYLEVVLKSGKPMNFTLKVVAGKHFIQKRIKNDNAFTFLVNKEYGRCMRMETTNKEISPQSMVTHLDVNGGQFSFEGVGINIERVDDVLLDFDTKKCLLKQSEFLTQIVKNYQKRNSFFIKTLDYFYVTNNNWFLPDTKVFVRGLNTNSIFEEKTYKTVNLYLKFIFSNRVVQTALHKKLVKKLTARAGCKFDHTRSVKSIQPFIDYFNIDMNEFEVPVGGYSSFNEFFARRLKCGKRMVEMCDGISSPADCRITAYKHLKKAQHLWIKGKKFSLVSLLNIDILDCSIFICRLAPQDYHRFHSPVRGLVHSISRIEGDLMTVHPLSVRTTDVLTENLRIVIEMTCDFGRLYIVAIGATLVGSIKLSITVGDSVDIMDELGWFEFGGSTILLIFENIVELEKGISINSYMGIETLVKVGNNLGFKNIKK